MRELESRRLIGSDIKEVLLELAELRIQTFFEYPYLYNGSLDYEMTYLNRYVKSSRSLFFGLWDQHTLIGATTGLPLADEDFAFQKPFVDQKINVDNIFYFGESLLKKEYRGQKLGHLFFDVRENYAIQTLKFSTTCFCSVQRPDDHPLRPADDRTHDQFWLKRGYKKQEQLLTQLSWQDRNENLETTKCLKFWTQNWTQ